MATTQRESDLLASTMRHPSNWRRPGCEFCSADGRGGFTPCEVHRTQPLTRSYIGTPDGYGAGSVIVVEQSLLDGALLASWDLSPIGDADKHAWGYAGRGPTSLARSILRDATGAATDLLAVLAFREERIEALDQQCGFGLTKVEVLSWVYDHRGHKGGSAVPA